MVRGVTRASGCARQLLEGACRCEIRTGAWRTMAVAGLRWDSRRGPRIGLSLKRCVQSQVVLGPVTCRACYSLKSLETNVQRMHLQRLELPKDGLQDY